MYLSDLLTVYANLTGHPALQVPLPFSEVPVGIQLMGPYFAEHRLFTAAYEIQRLSSSS
jgi:aspartyl-tRNA(Asn)/glutamyl-tRNA(Gln) amidotransferase subunit A